MAENSFVGLVGSKKLKVSPWCSKTKSGKGQYSLRDSDTETLVRHFLHGLFRKQVTVTNRCLYTVVGTIAGEHEI